MNCFEEFSLPVLNSMTKYPSIETYHEIQTQNVLGPELTNGESFRGHDYRHLYATEKINGTNGRILLCGNDYMIGGREDILWAGGKDISKPNYDIGILSTLQPIAERLVKNKSLSCFHDCEMMVLYLEVYGGRIDGFKEYTDQGAFGARGFDIAYWLGQYVEKIRSFNNDRARISGWREHGYGPFLTFTIMNTILRAFQIEPVPVRALLSPDSVPLGLKETYEWLLQFQDSKVILDDPAGCARGRAEGIVVRNEDRSMIRKLRYEDYEKTQRKGIF